MAAQWQFKCMHNSHTGISFWRRCRCVYVLVYCCITDFWFPNRQRIKNIKKQSIQLKMIDYSKHYNRINFDSMKIELRKKMISHQPVCIKQICCIFFWFCLFILIVWNRRLTTETSFLYYMSKKAIAK